jgi:hypothetical protein
METFLKKKSIISLSMEKSSLFPQMFHKINFNLMDFMEDTNKF